ncbi:TetR/AcrR family transcriptional regulator C-terminal domain-containing protein [Uniformispora flossi]|uniref:TetR/AcrR family transcriptional regulator C-terminal domain-containing protein n=1 Tax=Uniformispora flossi TaxID=3390723 RepID=UPI003C2E2079
MDGSKRGRGRPARIDRERIVQVALALQEDGRPLSMQAVADRLGVQRPALYHHVADRDALVALVAAARIEDAMDESWMPADDADWRTWLEAFARTSRESLLELTEPAEYQLFVGSVGRRQLDQVERLFAVLLRDGFAARTAGLAVTLVGELVHANVRSVLVLRRHDAEPHRASVAAVVAQDPEAFPALRAVGAEGYDAGVQFDFDLEAALTALEHMRR